jgi:DNA-binding transcriptional LysR family regulator
MNFNHLLGFHVVTREGNFTRAAKRLSISQPAITRRILDMERLYGVRLLERTSRRVLLTEHGHLLLSHVERLIALADEAELALKSRAGLKTGRIEIGTSRPVASYHLSSIAVSFKQRYPGVVPSIHVENSRWILNEVLAFRLDIGIVGVKPKHKDLIVFPFLDEELVILVPANHPWAKRKTVMLKELQDKPLILREKGSGTRGLIESEFNAAGIRPVVAMEVGSNEAIKRAVENNLGLAILPPAVVGAEISEGLFRILRISGTRLALSFHVIYYKDKRSSPLIHAFVEVLKEERPKLSKQRI